MVLGTASHVGKSLIVAGLGRIFADEGVRVAPFKAQNMSLNSAATADGREIGRAQALQAEACRVVPCAEMNPVLIKPSSDTGAQIVLLGRVWGQVTAGDYHRGRVEDLFPAVLESYATLAGAHELILLEGAGSPAEINLRAHDIVNMRMAHAADAACVLVGDIDRGGVFASLLGTLELLDAENRSRIRGFIVNKFRGDVSLLMPGIETIERRIGIPCVGVIPFLHDLGLEEEDSVAMEDRRTVARMWQSVDTAVDRPLRIGVVALHVHGELHRLRCAGDGAFCGSRVPGGRCALRDGRCVDLAWGVSKLSTIWHGFGLARICRRVEGACRSADRDLRGGIRCSGSR